MNGVIVSNQVSINLEKRLKARVVAVELLPVFTVVTKTGYRADSANVVHSSRIAGVTVKEIAIGTSEFVTVEGIVENPLWSWSIGNVLYLNGTSLSITPPTTGFRVIIAEAFSATKIYVKVSESILF